MSEQKPVAWAVMQPDSYVVFHSHSQAVIHQERCFGGEIVPLYRQPQWIPITRQLPPEGERVLFYLDDPLTEVSLGWWEGKWTHGKAIAMEYGDADGDWFPCSHWMPLPATSEKD